MDICNEIISDDSAGESPVEETIPDVEETIPDEKLIEYMVMSAVARKSGRKLPEQDGAVRFLYRSLRCCIDSIACDRKKEIRLLKSAITNAQAALETINRNLQDLTTNPEPDSHA